MNYIAIIGGLLFAMICGISAYIYYKQYKKQKEDKSFLENNGFLKEGTKANGELIFFYTKWCPHCKKAMPIWESITNSSTFAKYNLNFVMIDCENKDQSHIATEFNIEEYPSYILSINGKKYVYDANLDPNTLDRFLTAVYKKL